MFKLVGWTTTVFVLALLVWQSAIAEPLWPQVIYGLLIVIVSLLAGMRIGTHGAAAYTKDLQRLNQVLAEQNHALRDANEMFLKRHAAAGPKAPTKSSNPSPNLPQDRTSSLRSTTES